MIRAFATVDELALWLLHEAGVEAEPSIPIEALARTLGIDRVARGDLDGDEGMLEVRRDRLVLRVRVDVHPARQRFTIAHELGHLVLARPDLRLGALRRHRPLQDDEIFCDRLAAALLLPRPWLAGRAARSKPGLDALMQIAHDADTSLSATLVRLNVVARWRQALLRWTRAADGSWHVMSATGSMPRRIDTSAQTQRLLDAARGNGRIVDYWLPVRVAGRDVVMRAELKIGEHWALALVDAHSARLPWRERSAGRFRARAGALPAAAANARARRAQEDVRPRARMS